MEVDTNSTTVDINTLLKSYPSLQRLPEKNRVKCSWTEHEMPARADAIEKYVNGKKYQQLLKKKLDNDHLEKFKVFLEPSTKADHPRQLFCKLTWRHLNKDPHHILRHVEGKRFKRAYILWQECQANGTEYVPVGRRKKKQRMSNGDDDDQYTDLSEDEIVVPDNDDDLSDLYPDFRRLRTSESNTTTTADVNTENGASGKKRKAQASEIKKPKKLAAPSSKRLRPLDEATTNGADPVQTMKTVTLTI